MTMHDTAPNTSTQHCAVSLTYVLVEAFETYRLTIRDTEYQSQFYYTHSTNLTPDYEERVTEAKLGDGGSQVAARILAQLRTVSENEMTDYAPGEATGSGERFELKGSDEAGGTYGFSLRLPQSSDDKRVQDRASLIYHLLYPNPLGATKETFWEQPERLTEPPEHWLN